MDADVAVAGDQLRAIVERIEHVEEEIKELNDAKREIYLEAKGNGFDVKILREVIRLRKQDPDERSEQESLLDVYLQALNGDTPAIGGRKLPNGSGRARHGPGAVPS
jgi:uncharacterized protein (UPF0335 family)